MASYVTKTDFNKTITQINNAFTNVAGKTLYTNASVDINVDNLNKINNCENFSFTDLMNILNFRQPTVKLRTSLSTTSYEVGNTITGGVTLYADVTLGTTAITKLEFLKDDTVVSTVTESLDINNTFNYVYGVDIPNNTTFKVAVTTEDGTVVTDTIDIRFYYPTYYGTTSKDTSSISPTDITTMTKVIAPKGNKDYTYTASNERCVLAYPKSYGALSVIYDQNKFDNTNSFDVKSITMHSIEYYVYITKTLGNVNNFKYSFNY